MNLIKFFFGVIVLIALSIFAHITPNVQIFTVVSILDMAIIIVGVAISFYYMTMGCLEYCK